MYFVVEISGHQYKVKCGDLIDVQKLDSNVGDDLNLDQVLFVGGERPKVGTPNVSGAFVSAKVVKQARDRKKIVFKRSPGLWQKKRGHRQEYTGLIITALDSGSGETEKIDDNNPKLKKITENK